MGDKIVIPLTAVGKTETKPIKQMFLCSPQSPFAVYIGEIGQRTNERSSPAILIPRSPSPGATANPIKRQILVLTFV